MTSFLNMRIPENASAMRWSY